MRHTGVRLLWAIGAVVVSWSVGAAGRGDEPVANHARAFEGARRPALIALPPGAVEPQGWLRDWAMTASEGCTSRMDEVDEAFRKAWAVDLQQRGEGLNWPQGAWPYEGGGYWFDGLARLGGALHDPVLIEQARRRLGVVFDHMNDRSILFLWWLDRNNPEELQAARTAGGGWSLWASGLLGRAISGYYAATGNARALEAMILAYGSDPDGLQSLATNHASVWPASSLSNLWPAYDAYTYTGNRGIAQALDGLVQPGATQFAPGVERYRTPPDLRPGATVDNAHVVEFLESTTPWAVAYLWTGHEPYLSAALGWHQLLETLSMQPSGVPVADEYYGRTGAFRGTETCDVAGYVWSQVSLLAVTGDGRIGDRAERAFFNAGPATVTRDYRRHVYFQSPNRIEPSSPPYPHGPRADGGNYRPTHQPLCCTAAVNRIVPWYITHMWMATYDNGLAATCYGPSTVQALVGEKVPVEIRAETEYPFGSTIMLTVEPEREAGFPLSLRIPGWCERPSLQINGEAVAVEPLSNGFVRLERVWKAGDTVRLELPMQAVVGQGRDAGPPQPIEHGQAVTQLTIPEPNDTTGAPYATVSYGPLLFALGLPEADGDPNAPEPNAAWRYAIDVREPAVEVVRDEGPLPSGWNWPLASPLRLKIRAYPIEWNVNPGAPALPAEALTPAGPPQEVELVPYGCTKFRISMFPVVATTGVSDAGAALAPVPASRGLADVRSILILGNSLTQHDAAPEIGWDGNWGMAASAAANDFVHRLAAKVAGHAGTGHEPAVAARNIADFERGYTTYDVAAELGDLLAATDPDLVVLAIGENVAPLETAEAASAFRAAVDRLIAGVAGSPERRRLVVVRSGFWADEARDRVLGEASQAAGVRFVDVGQLGRDPAHAARSERSFTHDGVAGHPGDRGMEALAQAIYATLVD